MQTRLYLFSRFIHSTLFVSLGFAAFENVKYVFSYGLSVALPRAILAIPGHMGFAVFMGWFYGRAKLRSDLGDGLGARVNLALGYLAAVFLHGMYDTCCMTGTARSTLVFAAVVAVLYLTRKIMEAQDGYVDVVSKPGVGATFRLHLQNANVTEM